MTRVFLLSFLTLTLFSTCHDDDDMVQPNEEVIAPGLNIFECSEWEEIQLRKGFARIVEDTIYRTLHVKYLAVCAAGTRRFEFRAQIGTETVACYKVKY